MLKMPQAELETRHHFAPGVYVRELRIPAGVCLTGAVHKTEHMNICMSGKLRVVSATAPDRTVEGGDIFTSPAGTKRTAYVEEDTVWLTVHVTNETDIEKLEAMLVHNDRALLGIDDQIAIDLADYEKLVLEHRISPEYLEQLRAIEIIEEPLDGLMIDFSPLHGLGVFATMDLDAGFTAPALVNEQLHQWSRYCNHSKNPNAIMSSRSYGNTSLVLIKEVLYGEEITVDYRQVLRSVIWSKEE
jgi:hypothetical protein